MKRVKLLTEKDLDDNNITAAVEKNMSNSFSGCKRIAAIPAFQYKGMGDRIEIYDLESKSYIGTIYPDGACMLWPMCWYTDRKNLLKKKDYENEISYSDILNNKKIKVLKRVKLIQEEIIPFRKIKK